MQIGTNEIRVGMKLEFDREPYAVTSNEFVKPGKGQAFNRVKVKNLVSGRVMEKTFKSGEKVKLADVEETKMRMLYQEMDSVVFMHDETFDQINVPFDIVGDKKQWLLEETLYDIVIFQGNPIDITPPTFMELKVTETDPGVRGDTASGRVLKPAVLETGAKIQIPIFVDEGTKIKVDTRDGTYVSRIK